jgi:hypothetical protein
MLARRGEGRMVSRVGVDQWVWIAVRWWGLGRWEDGVVGVVMVGLFVLGFFEGALVGRLVGVFA